jgi:membrane protease YdiL (CAAX protease family)
LSKPRFFYAPDGRLRTLWRLLLFIALSLAFSIALAGIAVGMLVPGGASNAFLGAVVASWAVCAAFLAAHLVMLKVVDPRPWSDVGLGATDARLRLWVLGFLLGALGIAAPMGALYGVGWLGLRSAPDGSSLVFALQALALFVPAAFLEELMMRGYAFRALRDVWGWVPALVVTSFVFAALHWFNPNGCVDTWRQGTFDAQTCVQSTAMVMLAGVFLGGVLVYTGSLYAAWAAHFAWNWTMTGLLHAPVSGVSGVPGVAAPDFLMVDAGPDWATGGPWGPEGGLAAAVGMIAAFYVARRWWLSRQRMEVQA